MTVHPFIEAEKQAGHSVKRACELMKVSWDQGSWSHAVACGAGPAVLRRGLGQSKSLATCPTERSPRRHRPTISALKSGVNERRGRRGFFFPMLSMMDILPGLNP